VKPEKKFWYEIKAFNIKNNCKLSFTRVENTASWGTPDILGYNSLGHFFTIELKVTKTNKVRLSPHQIAFHVKHPNNTFILVKDLSLNLVKLYEGKVIKELDACGLKLEPCRLGLEACCLRLQQLAA
jgi:CHAT domain-containing protein